MKITPAKLGRYDGLMVHASHLPDFQLALLERFAERLRVGVARYGPEFRERDFRAETREELLDACVYMLADIERNPNGRP